MKIPGVYTPITKEKIEEPKDPVAINDAELVPCNWDIKEDKDGFVKVHNYISGREFVCTIAQFRKLLRG